MVRYQILVVAILIFYKHCKCQKNDVSNIRRSQSTIENNDKENFTCSDHCFEELSNYVNVLKTNTSIRIIPDVGTPKEILIKIDPVDFSKICSIYSTTVPCIKKCNEQEGAALLSLFKGLTFLCIDEYQVTQKHYKCIYESTVANSKVDECTVGCLENVTKAFTTVKDLNTTLDTCSSIRCAALCSVKFAKTQCNSEAVTIVHKLFKFQLEVSAKSEGWKKVWPQECSHLLNDLKNERVF